MGGMCSWGMGVGSGRDGENRAHGGVLEGVFPGGMVICVCVMAMRAHLAFLTRLTDMVICVCVITMRAPLAFLARLTGMVICVCVITLRAPLASLTRLTGMVICVCVMAMG